MNELKRAVERKKFCKGGLACPYCNNFNRGAFKRALTRRAKKQMKTAIRKEIAASL